MQRDLQASGRRWLEQASRDLDDARYVRDGERWSLACFLAQQCAEKALKGLLILLGVESPWGHSVAELLQQASTLDDRWETLRAEAAGLDVFYVPTRYPDALPGGLPADAFGEDDADRAFRKAEQVVEAVRRFFEDQPGSV